MRNPAIVLLAVLGVMTSACGNPARDQLSQCSDAIEREGQSTQGNRRVDLGPTLGVLDVTTLSDRLGDLEDSLQVMSSALGDGASYAALREHQSYVLGEFYSFQEAYKYAMNNHFEHCYPAR